MEKIFSIKEMEDNEKEFFDLKDALFELNENKKKYINLRKWVRYEAVDYGDADRILKEEGQEVLEKIGWKDTKYLDCIYSMKTHFMAFLRFYLNGRIPYWGELMDDFDEYFSDQRINSFCASNDIEKEDMEQMLYEMDVFAKNTHTLGNYMPCPDETYNKKKGYGGGYTYFEDRIELLYRELTENKYEYIDEATREKWNDWFERNSEKLFLNDMLGNSKLLSYKCPLKNRRYMMSKSDDIVEYRKYLHEVNAILLKRNAEFVKLCKVQK